MPVNGDIYWGMQVYDLFQENIVQLLEEKGSLDIRNYYVLCEHKFIMCKFVEILNIRYKISFLNKQVEMVHKLSQEALALMLKYSIKNDKQILHKIIIKLNDMKSIENEYLNVLGDRIKYKMGEAE